MGCNCKKNKPFNNLRNVDYINQARETYNTIIQGRDIDSFDDLEKTLILDAYKLLYPSSSTTPSIQDAVFNIKQAIELYDIRRKK